MTRKSPVRHKVKSHTRQGEKVKSYQRGSGLLRRKSKVVRRTIPTIYVDFDFSYPDPDRPEPISKSLTPEELTIVNTHYFPPRGGKIYHVTSRLNEILKSNQLRPGVVGFISLTTNPRVQVISPERVPKDARLELDFDALKRDYPELVPVSYSWTGDIGEEAEAYYKSKGFEDPTGYPQGTYLINSAKHFRNESEWLITKPIKNLRKYLVGIEVRRNRGRQR